MGLGNVLEIGLVLWKSEPQYAYKLYAYKKKHVTTILTLQHKICSNTYVMNCLKNL